MMVPNYKISDKIIKYVSVLLIVSLLFDVFLYTFENYREFAYFKGIIFYTFILYAFFKNVVYTKSLVFLSIICLILYWMCLVPYSSNTSITINTLSKVTIPFILFLICFNLKSSIYYFRYLYYCFSFVIIVTIIFGILSNIFGIGDDTYVNSETNSFITVGLGHGKLYAQAIALSLLPFIWYSFNLSKQNKILIIFLVIIAIVFSLISVRRTTLLIILVSNAIFFVLTNRTKYIFKYMPIISTIIIVSSPVWFPYMKSRIELRQNVFNSNYTIEEEGRYMEFSIILKEAILESNVKQFLFGKELFNSINNYSDGVLSDRMIHIDYLNILHGSGLIGLLLYIIMYIVIIKTYLYYRKINILLPKLVLRNLNGLFWSVIITSLIISFSGQMYEVTFRSMIFVVLGLIISILKTNQDIEYSKQK